MRVNYATALLKGCLSVSHGFSHEISLSKICIRPEASHDATFNIECGVKLVFNADEHRLKLPGRVENTGDTNHHIFARKCQSRAFTDAG